METRLTLFDLKEGEIALVTNILATGAMRRRLLDLGIIQGTPVECWLISPSGDPVAYLFRGAVIALRSEDSKNIHITIPSPEPRGVLQHKT